MGVWGLRFWFAVSGRIATLASETNLFNMLLCFCAYSANHHSRSSSLPDHMLHFPASISKQMCVCTRDAPMLPQQSIIHIHQTYQTTCFISQPAYQSRCVSAPEILRCFPSKASSICNKHTKPHASFPIHHTKADVSLPAKGLLCFPSSASFMINKHTKPHASFPSQHAKADVSMPPSIPKHILFVCQPANLGSRPASIPDYMLLCSTSSTHV